MNIFPMAFPKKRCSLIALAAVGITAFGGVHPASAQNIVNIDATLYGYNYPTDPAPIPGQLITPFSLAPGGAFNQLTLGPGTYQVTNATGLAGANPDFTAWRFNGGDNWTWSYVIANDATDTVVNYGEAAGEVGGVASTQSEIASLASVQNFSTTFTLPTTTRLDFMARDYYLPDNAGGVALLIKPLGAAAVPEVSPFALLALGFLPVSLILSSQKRRCRAK